MNLETRRVPHIMQFWGGVPSSANSKWLRTLRLVEKCGEKGWKTSVVLSDTEIKKDLVEPYREAGAEILKYKQLSGSLRAQEVYDVSKFLKKNPCDLIHCYNRPLVPLIGAAFRKVPARIWSRLAMSSNYETNRELTGIKKLQINLRLSCYFSKRIFCISSPVLKELEQVDQTIRQKASVLGAAVDFERYSSGSPEKIRKEFSLRKEDFLLLSIGHAVPVKGWDILLKAYAIFRTKWPDSKLMLVGSTDSSDERAYFSEIQTIIHKEGLSGHVIVTGKRGDIPEILAAADIFIQPSRSEGLCGALIEALAAGVPCIASNVGGTPDIIKPGLNGLMFEREDVSGLVRMLDQLLSDQDLVSTLKYNGVDSVQNFKLEAVTAEVIRNYEELLSRHVYWSHNNQ